MYRQDLDVIKGITIIVVVLFHMGLLKSGYLGVDAFFVINGFLIIPSVLKSFDNNCFSFWNYIEKRVLRLLPLIVLASAICLVIGFFAMMPDHYENLAQSVIASNLFSENILSSITSKDYWDVDNDFKPLMHLWYVGILMEFYVVLPLVFLVGKACARVFKKNTRKWMEGALLLATIISLVIYLLPSSVFDGFLLPREVDGFRFYLLPSRFFELGIGGLVALNMSKFKWEKQNLSQFILLVILVLVLCCSVYNLLTEHNVATNAVIGADQTIVSTGLPLPKMILLLATVLITCLLVSIKNGSSVIMRSRLLGTIGKMSYSIFIWHQVILAFYRYCFSIEITIPFFIIYIAVTTVISILSYYVIEKKIVVTKKSFVTWGILAVLLFIPSGWLYLHAGVSKDIPELECTVANAHRGMWGEYCDRIYDYDKDFPEDNGKINVLVEGISFGRDMANVILESSYKDSINLSYIFLFKEGKYTERIKKADVIFTLKSKVSVPGYVWQLKKPNTLVWGIGTKNYGACNGIVFKNRKSNDYFESTMAPLPGYVQANENRHKEWGEYYIDFMQPVMQPDGSVSVFTPDHYFISQDCSHLTPAGARWYAGLYDWNLILNR